MLIYLGYSCGSAGVDGSFGNDTLAALKKYQKEHGLAVDGKYGPLTKNSLTKAYNVKVAADKKTKEAEAKKAEKKTNTASKTKTILIVDGNWGKKTTLRLQEIFCTTQDGEISNQWKCYKNEYTGFTTGWEWYSQPNGYGSDLIRMLQKWAGMNAKEQDGEIGPKTIKAIEKKLGVKQTGKAAKGAEWIKALQKWANEKG